MNTQPGDLGGPVMTIDGQVIGVLVPAADNTMQLPAGVALAARSDAVRLALLAEGLLPGSNTIASTPVSAVELMSYANDLTVLVNCWE
jgi:hypothetical protein